MLNPIEKFKVAILHLNIDWNYFTNRATYTSIQFRTLLVTYIHNRVNWEALGM